MSISDILMLEAAIDAARRRLRYSYFLNDLLHLPKLNFQDHPMLAREYERVRAGKPPVPVDTCYLGEH